MWFLSRRSLQMVRLHPENGLCGCRNTWRAAVRLFIWFVLFMDEVSSCLSEQARLQTSSSANDQGGGEVPVRETPNGFSLSAAAEPRAADVSRTRTSMFDGTQEEDVERSVPSSWWAEDSDGSISDSHRRWDVWREGRGMGGGHVTPSVPG